MYTITITRSSPVFSLVITRNSPLFSLHKVHQNITLSHPIKELVIARLGKRGLPGINGVDGAPGAPGADGAPGQPGQDGENGVGVPIGGTTGQLLAKKTPADFDTEWIEPPEPQSLQWGALTGTLSNQTDLQAALDAKADEADLLAHTSDTNNPHNVTLAQVGGTNDHGSLSGLSDDDHPQYHNNTRGDARYLQLGATAGGDLSGTYPNPSVQDDSHSHTPGVTIPAYPTALPPSGPAGGDLSGTYPNPAVVDDSHNHTPGVTIPAYPTALPPSGAAGGDLSGTYPNPSVVDDSHAHSTATISDYPTTTDARYVKKIGDTMTGPLYGNIPVDTKVNILSSAYANNTIAYATDTNEVLVKIGGSWYLSPFVLVAESANPDMGYIQTSSRIGYGTSYITDKTINNIIIGFNATSTNGAIRTTSTGKFQVYLNNVWNDIVINFVLREDTTFGYALEHAPVGFSNYIEIMTGQTLTNLGVNGLPITNAYKTVMGAYGVPAIIGGRTI